MIVSPTMVKTFRVHAIMTLYKHLNIKVVNSDTAMCHHYKKHHECVDDTLHLYKDTRISKYQDSLRKNINMVNILLA